MVRSPDVASQQANLTADTVASVVHPDKVPKRIKPAEQEVGLVNVERILSELRAECDRICNENPDNYLFFTKYGGAVTQEKFDQDNQTDLDLRLVCFQIPDETVQEQVEARLQAIAGELEVELYFHSFEKYIAGQVGETGETTVLEKIQSTSVDESTVVHIEYPSLLSFYTFATMGFFTNRSDEALEAWIQSVTQTYSQNNEEVRFSVQPNLEMLNPQHIVEQITITERDVIEWIHVYVEHFLHDFQAFHTLDEQDQNNNEVLDTYLSRISKYLARVAFGVSIVDRNSFSLDEVEEKYLWHLRLGVSAEIAHFQVTADINASWFNTAIKDIINLATYIRAYSIHFPAEERERSEYFALISQIENTLLYIVQQGGGLIRRSEFNDVHDFLSEHAILNQIETRESKFQRELISQGEVILQQGTESNEIILIPTHKSDGSKNGSYQISADGEVIAFERSKVIVGELGVLLNIPRTTSVIAAEDLELIKVPKEEVARLFADSFSIVEGVPPKSLLANYLTGHYVLRENEIEDTQDAQLIFSFLAYFSDEFFKYLEEAMVSGRTFSSEKENTQNSLLDLYAIDYLPACFDWLLEHDTEGVFTVTDYANETNLFSIGEPADRVYFIHTTSENGGVEITFSDGSQTVLQAGEIVGEDALLPNENTRNYTARVLPGTKIIISSADGLRDATATTDTIFALVEAEDGRQHFKQHTRREVFFAIGVQCLKRLQSAYYGN